MRWAFLQPLTLPAGILGLASALFLQADQNKGPFTPASRVPCSRVPVFQAFSESEASGLAGVGGILSLHAQQLSLKIPRGTGVGA